MSVFSHLPDVGHGRCECGSPIVAMEQWPWEACYATSYPGPNCAMWRRGRSLPHPNADAIRMVRAARRAYWIALAEVTIPPAPLLEALGAGDTSELASPLGQIAGP